MKPTCSKVRCTKCGTDCTTAHCLCDRDDGQWCPACFTKTPCGRGKHGEGCATKVFDDGLKEGRGAVTRLLAEDLKPGDVDAERRVKVVSGPYETSDLAADHLTTRAQGVWYGCPGWYVVTRLHEDTMDEPEQSAFPEPTGPKEEGNQLSELADAILDGAQRLSRAAR